MSVKFHFAIISNDC